MKLRFLCHLLLLLALPLTTAQAAPARVLLIRHAEKPADPANPDLSPAGYARAQALQKLFQIHPEYATPGLPVAYFAEKYVPGKSANRCVETLTPLAQEYGISLQSPYSSKKAQDLVNLIFQNPDYDGKVVMIAWPHEAIPVLAEALGLNNPPSWDGSQIFDRVWIFDYTTGAVSFSDMPESVMPGDSLFTK